MRGRLLSPPLFFSGILLIRVCSAESSGAQPFAVSADFGIAADFPAGSVDGLHGWRVEQGRALIREKDGERALVIPPSEPHGQASLYFTPPAGGQPLFIDMTLKMGAAGETMEIVDANGSLTGLVLVDREGRLMVRNWESASVGSWLDTTVRLELDASGGMRDWSRLTFRQNPGAASWDLYVDGVMKGGNLGLFPDERESGGYFTLLGNTRNEVQLRGLVITSRNPLFEDADSDGLPDAWQKSLGQRDRDGDPDADGLTNLEEFLLGTSPSKADTDGDGLTDAEEVAGGRDPLTAAESGRPGVTAEFWMPDGRSRLELPSGLDGIRSQGVFGTRPSRTATLGRLEFSGLLEDGYVSRARGWIVAPVTGVYTFWISGDDASEFWLSTDDTPFLLRRTARVVSHTWPLEFDASPTQRSGEIYLQAGRRYCFEVQHQEVIGGDHFAVAWQVPGKRRAVIGGSCLEGWVPDPRDPNDDGLPDAWQKDHGLGGDLAKAENPLPPLSELPDIGPQADPDGDHLTNAGEYRMGTDPLKKDAEGLPGLITREVWPGTPGRYLFDAERSGAFPGGPSRVEYLDSFEGPRSDGTDYLSRIYGFIKVPESGSYRFHIAGDDQAVLFLGTDADKFSKKRIASVPVNSGWRVWDRFPSQTSAPVRLEKGGLVYIEALHKEADGDDYVTVAWTRPGAPGPEIIGGKDLVSWKTQADDTDGNGLPDDWQARLRLSAEARGGEEQAGDHGFKRMSAYGDADGDGVGNGEERLAGTDPLNPASHPGTGLQWQIWEGVRGKELGGLAAIAAFPASPSKSKILTNADYADQGQNYLSRLRGFITAPATGDYIFSLTGSGNCQFWLSPDESRFKKELIAEVVLATAWRHRTLNAGQSSAPVRLEAGKKYYAEILHRQGLGRDHLSAGWMIPGIGQTIILQDFLAPYEADPADSDDDGLPDKWETANELNAADPAGGEGAWGDPDGDLLSNYAEWRNGTHPRQSDAGKVPGLVLWEAWDSITGTAVDRLANHPRFPAQPDQRALLKSAEVPADRGAWYGGRLRGYLAPRVSGVYRMLVSGDDQAALYVSGGMGKFDRRLVARTPLWTDEREYTRYPEQGADVTFEAGRLYYFELLHKEQDARDHASVAWIVPGSKEPVIPGGAAIASFSVDPEDLDDDDLRDSWETAAGLDPHDNGMVDPVSGPWGDPDADGLTNLEEHRLGTSPVDTDSDRDGIEDGLEVNITRTSPASADHLKLEPLAVLNGASGTVSAGRSVSEGNALRTTAQSGTAGFPVHLDADGIVVFVLNGAILPGPPSIPFTLGIKVDGLDTGSVTLNNGPSGSVRAYGRLPRLRAGDHTLELSWSIPQRLKAIRLDRLTLHFSAAPLPGDGTANGLKTNGDVLDSLTSPLCLEGTALFPALVRIAGDPVAKPLPDSGWYADTALPEDGAPLLLDVDFENGLAARRITLQWRACNVFTSGNLLVRAGDALRLAAWTGEQARGDSLASLLINGKERIPLAPGQAVPWRFTQPGTYEVEAEYSTSEPNSLETRGITVTVLDRQVPDHPGVAAGTPGTVVLPALAAEVELLPDSSLYFSEIPDSAPREFSIYREKPGTALIAHRLPSQGPVLGTSRVVSFEVLSDMDTWYGITREEGGTLLVEMDVFLPDMTADMRLKIEILAPGVTFEDGSSIKWVTVADADENHIARVRFLVTSGMNTSFCHRMTLYQGDRILRVW